MRSVRRTKSPKWFPSLVASIACVVFGFVLESLTENSKTAGVIVSLVLIGWGYIERRQAETNKP